MEQSNKMLDYHPTLSSGFWMNTFMQKMFSKHFNGTSTYLQKLLQQSRFLNERDLISLARMSGTEQDITWRVICMQNRVLYASGKKAFFYHAQFFQKGDKKGE